MGPSRAGQRRPACVRLGPQPMRESDVHNVCHVGRLKRKMPRPSRIAGDVVHRRNGVVMAIRGMQTPLHLLPRRQRQKRWARTSSVFGTATPRAPTARSASVREYRATPRPAAAKSATCPQSSLDSQRRIEASDTAARGNLLSRNSSRIRSAVQPYFNANVTLTTVVMSFSMLVTSFIP